MPDFERIVDHAIIDFAKTPEDKAWAKGFVEGKNYARREVAGLTAFLY